MKAQAKNTIFAIVLLAVGYALGVIISIPSTSGDQTKGDISKVKVFRKSIAEPQYSAFEAKLLNDTLALAQESLTKDVLSLKLREFATLVDSSIIVAGDIEELKTEVDALREVKEMSLNAAKTAQVADDAFENLENGNSKDLGISYEQASQNLAIAYSLIDKQVKIGKKFAIAADQYYTKHKDLSDLASVRDGWALFCSENALLNGDEQEQEYWADNSSVNLANSKLIKVLAAHEFAVSQFDGKLNDRENALNLVERTQLNKDFDQAISKKDMAVSQKDLNVVSQKDLQVEVVGRQLQNNLNEKMQNNLNERMQNTISDSWVPKP